MAGFRPVLVGPVERDTDSEIERVVLACIRRLGLDSTDLIRMNDNALDRLRADAFSNRHLHPVPTTDPEFLYHGTSRRRLRSIAAQGLVLGDRDSWGREIAHDGWSIGKAFVVDTVGRAEFYALAKSKKSPMILRVRREALLDIEDDTHERPGSYYVTRIIPAADLEFWSGRRWKACHARPVDDREFSEVITP